MYAAQLEYDSCCSLIKGILEQQVADSKQHEECAMDAVCDYLFTPQSTIIEFGKQLCNQLDRAAMEKLSRQASYSR